MAKTKIQIKKIDTGLSGVAGEFFVAAELSRKGHLATLTQRNAKGIDILASNGNASKLSSIQVKTNQGCQNYWLLNVKAEEFYAPRLFYVFVNLGTPTGLPEYYIAPSKTIAAAVKHSHKVWLITPGKNGHVRQDTTMRKLILEKKYLNRWDLLDLD